MTRILVVYGTTNGHTAKIAAAIADTLRAGGALVDVHQVGRTHYLPDGYDGIIAACPVRGGKYLKAVRGWARANAPVLNARTTGFVSVCLGILQHDAAVDRALGAITSQFITDTGWRPTVTMPVAGALLYTRYNWFIRRMMKRIVARHGGDHGVGNGANAWGCIRHLRTLLFAQLTGLNSLREIEHGLAAQPRSLYHLDLRLPRRSTLADAMASSLVYCRWVGSGIRCGRIPAAALRSFCLA